ncbi:hypothetical protein LIX17_05080 [Mycobacterium avium subsp. hominissuis]|uniref:DUF4832 domain-containing protein n=2 Tax=Mycobacterium avium TaxID=1764 RepID=A0A2A2ZMH5_MYCAV|nr:hypothetical protein [Mycobacterium avium]MBG0725668.1 hypothetical protein [Mycobacterium avium]MCA2235719.1 hypothetical protein [Mycobacterium avium]MCA4733424.1 hypothetical protein [Mycobacterium avium subsp. hominissuis]MCA4737644.1 hypothetical protein [Mycobacterium avium subsp. hominissuis]MCA4742675.1 hypothetical protein [Mycobacterium avium subsp. hominissuis]
MGEANRDDDHFFEWTRRADRSRRVVGGCPRVRSDALTMVCSSGKRALAAVIGIAAVLSGCGGKPDPGPLSAMVSPAIPPTAQEIPNPLRGQYEQMLNPLFPQGNSAQQRYSPWPASYDASLRVSWRQLQPVDPRTLPPDAPDDRKFDFSAIDDALAKLGARNMRLTLGVYTYRSCCNDTYPDNSAIAIPDWLRPSSTSYPPPNPAPGVTQVVPNFNDPDYLNGVTALLAALGRRYDGDERLSVFEFSGYGDFGENQLGYPRDSLGAPGPAPDDSVAKLGYYSQFRDQSITKASIAQLVAANTNAFPHTQLVVAPQNPEIVRQLLADDVTKKLSAPVGIRADCLGVQSPLPEWAEANDSHYVRSNDAVVAAIKQRLGSGLVISQWCRPPKGADSRSYYEKGLHDVIRYHVSMTSSADFPDRDATSAMDPELYLLWGQANTSAGYRYSVEAKPGSQSIQGKVASISVVWTNYGAAAATEHWVAGYKLVDFSGAIVRSLPATVNLKTLVHDESSTSREEPVPESATESVHVDVTGLAPGHYTLRATVDWQQHKPDASHVVNYAPMALARDGRDGAGLYPIATLDIPSDAGSASGH